MKLFGALEAGGTKMVCAVGDETGRILERTSIPTQTPEQTMPAMIDFFKDKGIAALGIGCFGPVDLDRKSLTYGCITSTPKLAWRNYPIVDAFEKALGVPVGFDTDVNAAALGEATWGCTRDVKNSIYITIGTGVGVGVIIGGEPYHGMIHPVGVRRASNCPTVRRFGIWRPSISVRPSAITSWSSPRSGLWSAAASCISRRCWG